MTHPLHPHHQLKLLLVQCRQDADGDDDDDDDDRVAIIQRCKACLQPIIDSSYYICTEESAGCKDYSLHRFCAELPVEMKHALHPLHPLMLILSPPFEHFKCFACREFCEGCIYSCRICSFQLAIICAATMNRVLEHNCHQHPLTLLPRSISSFCDACCRVHEGIFYQCNTCVVFFIHQDCASLGYEINHQSHQGHPLRLGFPSDGTQKKHNCDICYKLICNETGWFYYCWECKFYSHLNCIMSEYLDPEIDPEIPCLPWEEADNEFDTVGLLNRSFQNVEYKEMDTIEHFSHYEHPLVLQSDVPREANPYSVGEITLKAQCNGSCKQISAPLYSCADCHFYIHKGCALLPTSIAQHHAHSEHDNCRLLLVREHWQETRVFRCDDCRKYCNGFCYQCEEESCKYQIDVECAFLPKTFIHKAHPFHTLTLASMPSIQDNRFKCCAFLYSSSYVYRCDSCSFLIDTRCAMYPAHAHHRFDCDRPFMLSYNPSAIEPNEYHYCDICEDILDPKLWFYFSSKLGGQIMHPHCLLLRDRAAVLNPNLKSISPLLKADIHPHFLYLYPTYGFKRCYHCEIKMEDHNNNTTDVHQPFDYACQCVKWDCEYQIHVRCANEFILQAKDDFQETVDICNEVYNVITTYPCAKDAITSL